VGFPISRLTRFTAINVKVSGLGRATNDCAHAKTKYDMRHQGNHGPGWTAEEKPMSVKTTVPTNPPINARIQLALIRSIVVTIS